MRKAGSIWTTLLEGIEPALFFSTIWGQKHCHLSGKATRFSKLLNWSSYENLVTRSRSAFNQENVRVVIGQKIQPFFKASKPVKTRNGEIKQLSLSKLKEYMDKGATFVLRGVRSFSDPIASFAEHLERESECRVSTNLYATPPGCQGFPAHFDTHDIFVLQLEGAKEWQLRGFTREAPTKRDSCENFPLTKPNSTNVTLKRGDVLYLPRGLWHSAAASKSERGSLHLSLGVHAPTGIDLMEYCLGDLNEKQILRQDLLEFEDGRLGISRRKVVRVLANIRQTFQRSNELERHKLKEGLKFVPEEFKR